MAVEIDILVIDKIDRESTCEIGFCLEQIQRDVLVIDKIDRESTCEFPYVVTRDGIY